MAHPNQNLPTVSARRTNPAPAPIPAPPPPPGREPQPAPAPNKPPPPVFDFFPQLDLTWLYSLFG